MVLWRVTSWIITTIMKNLDNRWKISGGQSPVMGWLGWFYNWASQDFYRARAETPCEPDPRLLSSSSRDSSRARAETFLEPEARLLSSPSRKLKILKPEQLAKTCPRLWLIPTKDHSQSREILSHNAIDFETCLSILQRNVGQLFKQHLISLCNTRLSILLSFFIFKTGVMLVPTHLIKHHATDEKRKRRRTQLCENQPQKKKGIAEK